MQITEEEIQKAQEMFEDYLNTQTEEKLDELKKIPKEVLDEIQFTGIFIFE